MWKRAIVGAIVAAGCAGTPSGESADAYDVSESRPMRVRAVSPLVGRAEGYDQWGRVLPEFPADLEWPTDAVSQATRAHQLASQAYRDTNPAERTVERTALHRTRDAVLRTDAGAAQMTIENGATPWQAAIALHRLTEHALDRRQLEDPEDVERAAVALLVAAPDHPASIHARFVLANLAASPSLSTYDPEQALAWALDALEHDPSVVAEVARLLEVLPGDLPLPDWAYDLMRPQWQADQDAARMDATFDHAVRLGHVEDALNQRDSVVRGYLPWCNMLDAAFVCEDFLHWDEASTARMLRLGWTTSDDWRAHAHAALAECAIGVELPVHATLSWQEGWELYDAPDAVADCVLAELVDAPHPTGALSIPVDVTR